MLPESASDPSVATLIALCDDKAPLVGVVDLPALGRRFHAVAGSGAWEGTRQLRVAARLTQRELARLEASGLVTVTRVGKQKHYQANAAAPVFEELRSLVLKTFGLSELLRGALEPLSSSIRVCTVERMAPIASTGTRNHGSGRSGRSARPMLVLPELEAPLSRMIRPPRSSITRKP